MVCTTFLFCMLLGKYTSITTNNQAFALEDVTFFIGLSRLDNLISPNHKIEAATSITYLFTEQKSGHKGDIIAHRTRGNFLCCPGRNTVCQFMLHCCEFCCSNKHYNNKVKLASYYNSKFVNVPIKTLGITKVIQTHDGKLRSEMVLRQKNLLLAHFTLEEQ